MKYFTHSLTILGTVKHIAAETGKFSVECRSGDVFEVFVTENTNYNVLQNLDNLNRDRVLDPEDGFDENWSESLKKVKKYIWPDGLVMVQGIFYHHNDNTYFEAKTVHLLHYDKGKYLFESTHWWLTQIQIMANEWLDDFFGDKRSYLLDDFVGLYRTNLNIVGLPTDDSIQEMATLSRFIYGLSSAYLLTGSQRYLDAARAGVKFQRDAFRILTHDGHYCFWAFGRKKLLYGSELIEYSLNGDDYGTVPLYEQIYALAGLAQFYRITADLEVLEDIKRTVFMFRDFYRDSKETNPEFPGLGGYFSHIDYVSRRPDDLALGDNTSRKNWNSIGDHIPAYLLNLILALEPLPQQLANNNEIAELLKVCKEILRETSELIVEHFRDKEDPNIPYVQERFHADWTADKNWRWQKDRAVVGHNLKISWNLTRVANYYRQAGDDAFAEKLMEKANFLGKAMAETGIDPVRGGCFDAVERKPTNNMPIQFAWGNTKDFWQQEQAVLAYLILYGNAEDKESKEFYLRLSREMNAFWNLFFLDHDNRGVFFRVTDDGLPVVQGNYANKAGHSIAGYHSFELNFLAHLYLRSYVDTARDGDGNFVLYFKPDPTCRSINILPDCFPPGLLEVVSIKVNGVKAHAIDPDNFQIEIQEKDKGANISVEFKTVRK